ncbi:UDP-N-acetylmuramoyl-tripeptide--D-alanyl-D-alanine ligase [Cerasicoccus arenae]|uniref:UDP-N-acetylmuramoyl-tripeptide--D-alanyl-D-alanine ligase n=1 Tax=Cerasicoccus arenae TaxID=424488 RepID=A0A8J3DIF1_9BACT|nr:UDP-N-acetylmuramoyl-tripeptide--D-alanyl-D-alanine ligase [Cerasicoccus arenae]MBK1856858.1 UDP-N-acetylmuramoyl-tripeptide--D-alanyl-D-alanine ligase [Cerasicoccus arenae]GHC11326.1 UDP-N-acetylmuramoyl-tripeptide--D-alanyl-D-alanine ligase [Cerasicoccus arenae]
MPAFSPQLLAEWTTGQWMGAQPNTEIRGFCHDTRKLRPGDCFVALKTEQRDGHDFLASARDAGAAAALVSNPREDIYFPQLVVEDSLLAFQTIAHQHRHAFSGKVIGVTGSCGKTSTKDLLAHLLGASCLRTEKNLNNTLGVPLTLTSIDPDKHEYAVVEAGINQPGEMTVLGGMIAPDFAVVTMIGPAHMEKLGSMANIAHEKAELIRFAVPGASLFCGGDCLKYEAFHHFSGEIFAVCETCEESPALDYTEYRSCFRFFREGETTRVQIFSALFAGQFVINAVLTSGMVSNVVLAVLTAIRCGAKWPSIEQRLLTWQPGADRGAVYHFQDNLYYVDCYNANPASMRDALDTFAALTPPEMPRLYVLGGMKELGDSTELMHRKVGAELTFRPEDRAVLVGDEGEAYADGLREAGAQPAQLTLAIDTASAHDAVDGFSGALFLKGSRAYALEALLPAGVLKQKEAAAC